MKRTTVLREIVLATSLCCGAVATLPAFAVPSTAASGGAHAAGVAWRPAASDADIEKAFAAAGAEHKPVLLYWGASWCPPCNQLKATLFNRQDFIERSRAFVAVHVDGDLPGAQKLGSRFKVRGYPTMILFTPAGQEITRLPGEAEPQEVLNVLELGLARGRPVKAVLADALAGRPLDAQDWRLLAFYSWDTDEQQLLPQADKPSVLAKLAGACPASEVQTATRLRLKALAEAPEEGSSPDAATKEAVQRLLADPAASRAQMDVLTNFAPELVKALAGRNPQERARWSQAMDQALQRLVADESLSRADRADAVLERVELARLQAGIAEDARSVKLPAPLVQSVREEAAREDREITDGYERQAVISTAAQALERAGLLDESDALLRANLAKSHSPYYLMSHLASNAKARGDKAAALDWYRKAYERSEGPATRLQWGAAYVSALVELSPQDTGRIEKTVQQLWKEAGAQPNAFYERSARSLQRVGGKLLDWNSGGTHRASLQRMQAGLEAVCRKLDPADVQRATCESVLKPAAKKQA